MNANHYLPLLLLLFPALLFADDAKTKDLAQVAPSRFDVHVNVNDLSDDGVPVVQPWKTFKLDPEYRGGWMVVGDLTGDGIAEIVSARNGVPGRDIYYTSSVVVHRLDGSVLWKWGNPDA